MFDSEFHPEIRIIGIGNAGIGVLECLRADFPEWIELIAIDTDIEILNSSNITNKLHIAPSNRCGIFCSLPPEMIEEGVRARTPEIRKFVDGADIVIIITCMGGVTGTGIAPLIASVCREMNVFTIGFVTTPFSFEGKPRHNRAEAGVKALLDLVNTLIHIPCQYLLQHIPPKTSINDAFKFSDEFISQSVNGLINPLILHGLICTDLADLIMLFKHGGFGGAAIGSGTGENRADYAITNAIGDRRLISGYLPLIDAHKIWFNIEGGSDLSLNEIQKIMCDIHALANPDAAIVFNDVINDKLNDTVRLTLLAAGGYNADNMDGMEK